MKKLETIISTFILITLISCNGNGEKADGYGNFEATETTISSEANGKLLSFSVVEGITLNKNTIVGIVDTVQLSLKRDQLLAARNTVFSKSREQPDCVRGFRSVGHTQRLQIGRRPAAGKHHMVKFKVGRATIGEVGHGETITFANGGRRRSVQHGGSTFAFERGEHFARDR